MHLINIDLQASPLPALPQDHAGWPRDRDRDGEKENENEKKKRKEENAIAYLKHLCNSRACCNLWQVLGPSHGSWLPAFKPI